MNPEGFHEFIKELRKNLDMPPFYEIEVKTLEVVQEKNVKLPEQDENLVQVNSEKIKHIKEVMEAMEVIKEKNVKFPKEPGENLVEVNSEEINYVKEVMEVIKEKNVKLPKEQGKNLV